MLVSKIRAFFSFEITELFLDTVYSSDWNMREGNQKTKTYNRSIK